MSLRAQLGRVLRPENKAMANAHVRVDSGQVWQAFAECDESAAAAISRTSIAAPLLKAVTLLPRQEARPTDRRDQAFGLD
jgi:hypothetical protein